MIATVIAMLLSMQSDTTRASREAFTRCLGRFVDASMEASKTTEQFNAEFPQACATEQAAFRASIIARDTASRSTRASAEGSANAEIEDARFNFNDRFQGAQPQQQASAAPAARPAATPATPAAQTAAQTTPAPAAQQASQPH